MEAWFAPSRFWGCEFLEGRVRLCAWREKDGKPQVEETFEGSYAEAEAFARKHGLGQAGLYAAFSHLPFKLGPWAGGVVGAGGAAGTEEDLQPALEGLKPTGLSADALDFHVHAEARLLAMAREETLQDFRAALPPALGGHWELSASPLALLPFLDLAQAPRRFAALLPEEHYCHVLFFFDGYCQGHAKIFAGWAEAGENPAAFALELKRAVYHDAARFPGQNLEAFQLWNDGPKGEVAGALATGAGGLGSVAILPLAAPVWKAPLGSVPPAFRVAAAMALQGLRGATVPGFTLPVESAPRTRRLWMGRAGVLARYGFLAWTGSALAVLLLGLSVLGMRLAVEMKADAWSGELRKWDEYQKRKSEVEGRLQGLEGLLLQRTRGHEGLQRVSALLPSETWMEEWEMQALSESEGEGFSHKVTGYALQEGRIPEFLGALEKAGFAAVKLKSTEKVKAETVEKKTGIAANRRDLTRFQIGLGE